MDPMHFEDVICDHLLPLVLRHLPLSDTPAAAQVCSRWREACASQALWQARLPAALRSAAACGGGALSQGGRPIDAQQLVLGLYRTNLLLNPSLQLSEQLPNRQDSGVGLPGRGRTPWFSLDSWRWEGERPEGLPDSCGGRPPLPPLPPPPLPQLGPQGPLLHPHAVLTSPNNWAAMMQVVDLTRELQRRGLPADTAAGILDTCPPLELTIWYGGHRHGRARCEVWLALDDGAEELPSWLDAIDVAGGRYAAVATTRAQPCPAGGWAQARLRLQGYPAGCRRATVVLKGMGGSAVVSENVGVFGAKFAAPTLRLLPEDEV